MNRNDRDESFLQRAFQAVRNSGRTTKVAIIVAAIAGAGMLRLNYLQEASLTAPETPASTTVPQPTPRP